MTDSDLIEEQNGRYYIRGTRISVRNVADVLGTGSITIPMLADDWDVSEEALEAALDTYDEHKGSIQAQRAHATGRE